MYNFHIKPISPDHASEKVATVYKDITDTLHIPTVPLVFQYLSLYDQYFFYLWDRIKVNLLSEAFHASCAEIKELTYQTIPVLPTPSSELQHLVSQLHPHEHHELTETVTILDDVNITLMLLTIGIRESLKGVPKSTSLLPEGKKALEETLEDILQITSLQVQEGEEKGIIQASRMLAPLLGNNNLMITRYPEFFASVATEMRELNNMPAYLQLRVTLEHQTLAKSARFIQPLDCSYVEFLHMTEGKPHIDEILFLLKDTFASHFPHLVLTTAVMKHALQSKNNTITLQ